MITMQWPSLYRLQSRTADIFSRWDDDELLKVSRLRLNYFIYFDDFRRHSATALTSGFRFDTFAA